MIKETEGVYICWTGTVIDDSLKVIKVGYGYIYDLIIDLRSDVSVKAFEKYGVFFTWARVPSYKMIGITAFLQKKLKPAFLEENIDKAWQYKVNLPWDDDETSSFKQQLSGSASDAQELPQEVKQLPW